MYECMYECHPITNATTIIVMAINWLQSQRSRNFTLQLKSRLGSWKQWNSPDNPSYITCLPSRGSIHVSLEAMVTQWGASHMFMLLLLLLMYVCSGPSWSSSLSLEWFLLLRLVVVSNNFIASMACRHPIRPGTGPNTPTSAQLRHPLAGLWYECKAVL